MYILSDVVIGVRGEVRTVARVARVGMVTEPGMMTIPTAATGVCVVMGVTWSVTTAVSSDTWPVIAAQARKGVELVFNMMIELEVAVLTLIVMTSSAMRAVLQVISQGIVLMVILVAELPKEAVKVDANQGL